jgi:hypothetical protein
MPPALPGRTSVSAPSMACPLTRRPDEAELPGFAIGTFTLRPTLDQRIIRESVRFGNSRTSRTYSQTSLSGTVQSDWSTSSIEH